nr:ribonuclease H-like domain-containing protein [Tanacetum cinerariifolium]
MFVHNSFHNSPVNSNHDDDVQDPDPVTRISKLEIRDPLHLHPNDNAALSVISIKLKGAENYQVWSCATLLALEEKNKIGFIDGSCKRSNTDDILGFKKHNQLLKLMQILMGLDDFYMQIRSFILSREVLPDVRSALDTISSEESHRVAVGSVASSSQKNQASAFVSNVPNSKKFQIKVLPDVRSAYDTISSEESHRVAVGSVASSSQKNQASAFVSNVPNSQNFPIKNKVIVAFDENRCYFLNKDLNLKNVLGIDGEAMINSIQNGDQPLPIIAQVSLAGIAQNAPPTLKDPKFWTAKKKKTRKIDRLA